MNRPERKIFDAFNELVTEHLPKEKTQRIAFEKASEEFERRAKFTAYDSYEAFKNAKSRVKKKRETET